MDDHSLKNRASKGLFWSIGERVATQGTLFLISIVLARLLSPDDYGILAILLVFVNLADVLVTDGLGSSLIQRSEIRQIDYSTIFLSGAVLSLFLYVVIFLSAGYIADFYNNHNIAFYLQVLALRIPLSSFYAIQRAYVSKNLRFRDLFIASFFGSLIAGSIAIVLAIFGWSIYALIVQQLVSIPLSSIAMFAVNRWLPGCSFSKRSFKELFPLGMEFSGASFINALYINGRSLLIGKVYTPADLAFYNRGEQFPSLLVNNLNNPIANVLFPVLAEVKDDGKSFKAVAKKSLQVCVSLIFPLIFLLAVSADDLVLLLLTEKWADCVPYLVVLCVFYLFQPLQTVNNQLLKAAGKGTLCFRLEIIKKLFCFAALIIAIPYGVMAIALSSVIAGLISTIIGMVPNRTIVSYGLYEQFKDTLKPIACSIAASLAAISLEMVLTNAIETLVLQFVVGIAVYLVASILIKNEGVTYVLTEVKDRYKRFQQ